MSANSVHCHVLGGQVTVITDLAGNVTNVACSLAPDDWLAFRR